MDSPKKMAAATKRTETVIPALAPPERESSATGGGAGNVFVGVGVVVAVSLGKTKAEEVLSGEEEAIGALMLLDIVLDTIEIPGEFSEAIDGAGVVPAIGVGDALDGIGLELELVCSDGTCGVMPTAIQALMNFSVAFFRSFLLHDVSTQDSDFLKRSPVEQWQRRSISSAQPSSGSASR